MMVIDVGRLTDIDEFKERVDDLFRKVKNSPLAPGYDEILIPGDPERRKKDKNLKEGIFVEDKTWNAIVELAEELDIETR